MQTGLDRVCLRTNLLAIGPVLHMSAPVRRGAVADAWVWRDIRSLFPPLFFCLRSSRV